MLASKNLANLVHPLASFSLIWRLPWSFATLQAPQQSGDNYS